MTVDLFGIIRVRGTYNDDRLGTTELFHARAEPNSERDATQKVGNQLQCS